MKLLQLRYLVEIAKVGSISAAAERLCTSQSGVSKQIISLEQELGIALFNRKGRNLAGLTSGGLEILKLAEQVVGKAKDIRSVADELNNLPGALSIATTHTQARYILPYVVEKYLRVYPETALHIQQGTPEQVAAMLAQGEVDIAIATESLADHSQLVAMPCYRWNRCVIVNLDHPLVSDGRLTLDGLAKYPIITYVTGFTGRRKFDEAFAERDLRPDIVLAAVDADVIKTYVRLGLGIGIIAEMAYHPEQDKDLVALNAAELFGSSISQLAVRRDAFIRKTISRFVQMFAPHLTEELIREASECADAKARDILFERCAIPSYTLLRK